MSEWLDRYRDRRGGVTIQKIHIAAAISILIHIAALWQWVPHMRRITSDLEAKERGTGPLVVQLERRPPPAPRAPPVQPQRRPSPPQPRVAPKPPPPAPVRPQTPPVIVRRTPAPSAPAIPAPPPAPKATPAPPRPQTDDFAAYVEARQRARGEAPAPPAPPSEAVAPAPPAEDPNARANRIAAANLGLGQKPTMGDRQRGGGVFTIRRMGYDYAEFFFYGWNRDMRRNTAQVIEVRKGSNASIQIAVVRRMIGIIRDHEQGDFIWESQRLGRNISLSARQRDNAGLEDFMMQEFFDDPRQPYSRETPR